jgi:mannan endo-1,4-beta-mannosidase
MHKAQSSLRDFVDLIEWGRFERSNWNAEARVSDPSVNLFACGDGKQVIVWLLRGDSLGSDGKLRRDAAALSTAVSIPCMAAGYYIVTAWDTDRGAEAASFEVRHPIDGPMNLQSPPLARDLAFAIRRRK